MHCSQKVYIYTYSSKKSYTYASNRISFFFLKPTILLVIYLFIKYRTSYV
jgi:hypothetical protein